MLRRHDLFFYIEGGRSYTGDLKAPKTGLVHAALQAEVEGLVIVPTAVAYDAVLEDRILSHQGVKRRQRPFSRELAEMVGSAVGLPHARLRHLRRADRDDAAGIITRVATCWSSRISSATASGCCTRCCRPRSSPRR